LALSLLADLREEEVAAVALDLLAAEGSVLHDGKARLRPALESALEVDHVGVAEIVQGLGCQHGAQSRLTVQHDGSGRLGRDRAHAKLEEAAADIVGALDRAVSVLVRIADVYHYDGLTGVDALLQLGRGLFRNDLAGLPEHLLQCLHARAPCGDCLFGINAFILPPIPVGTMRNTLRPRPVRWGSRLL